MELEILGQAKTVRMRTKDPHGNTIEAPMEIMLAALVQTLSQDDKVKFFSLVTKMQEQHADKFGRRIARVVAEVEMPHIHS